jgi:superoxide reductase
MTKVGEIYKCGICGNVVSVVSIGGGTLVCCGQNMNLLEEKTSEQEGQEKHVPVVSINNNKVSVKVGSVEHPMEEKHYIELIQLVMGSDVIMDKKLKPGETPEVEFYLDDVEGVKARALCNVHGLWIN